MLNILLLDSNYYHALGLRFLITEHLTDEEADKILFLLASSKGSQEAANIIFQDYIVTIKINNKNSSFSSTNNDEEIITHIPFSTRNQTINDLSMKIAKILSIVRDNYNHYISKEQLYWRFRLESHSQLSDAEKKVMILFGRGYNSVDISKILNRSRKTIRTHFRSASRKMDTPTKVHFYRFASFIANCDKKERNTLCL